MSLGFLCVVGAVRKDVLGVMENKQLLLAPGWRNCCAFVLHARRVKDLEFLP